MADTHRMFQAIVTIFADMVDMIMMWTNINGQSKKVPPQPVWAMAYRRGIVRPVVATYRRKHAKDGNRTNGSEDGIPCFLRPLPSS